MTKLSVNINKIATIRNARGGNTPSVVEAAKNCQNYGADGITIHPRQDERHITKKDVYDLKEVVTKEYNIEGYPSKEFIDMVIEISPDQVTLVPDGPDVITSCAGWDTNKYQNLLTDIISIFKAKNIRTSIFIDPLIKMVGTAAGRTVGSFNVSSKFGCTSTVSLSKSLSISPESFVIRDSVYRMAAARSPSTDPKFPCPSTSSCLIEKSCAILTRAS